MIRLPLWPGLAAAGAILLAVGLTLASLAAARDPAGGLPPDFAAQWITLSLLPRIWVALLSGGALGLSALVFQQVLRNPLAEPATLGVLSGAQLGITLATMAAVSLDPALRELVGLAGGLAALGLVILLAGRNAAGPALLVAGLVVSLVAGSVFVLLALFQQEQLRSVFVWASGNLAQNGSGDARALALRLALLAPLLLLLLRGLALFALSDAGVRGLGGNVVALRLLALGLATLLATMVTARVGVIGFVGLAAPLIAAGLGAGGLRARLLLTPVAGAVLLLLADGVAQGLGRLFSGRVTTVLPTGVLTPVLGAAILLALLWLRRIPDRPGQALATRRRHPPRAVALALLVLLAAVIFSLCETVHLPGLSPAELWQGRWPRVLSAVSAGVMLALAGVVIQATTGNPMASPESLGLSSGAGLGIVAGLFAGGAAGLLTGAVAGALLAFLLVMLIAARNRFAPGPLLLAGVAIGTFAAAMISLVIASGDPRAVIVLAWSMGPTYRAEPAGAVTGAVAALAGLMLFPLLLRWLRILPLGAAQTRALGARPAVARAVLMVYVAVLTGFATLAVGPISFAGLMAPHLARVSGAAGPGWQGFCAAAWAAALLVAADLAGRLIWFLYEIPAGVLASLLGAPLFLWLIGRRR